MVLDSKILKKRLKIAFEADSQETIGKKLNMSQGNVSKLLSGTQQPTLETMYHIANVYYVSVDWLLGFSEKKSITKYNGKVTYSDVVKVVSELKQYGAEVTVEQRGDSVLVKTGDPLIRGVLKKALDLLDADQEMYESWLDDRLSMFDDCPLIRYNSWHDERMQSLTGEAITESNWLEVYDAVVQSEKEFAEMIGANVSPFSR